MKKWFVSILVFLSLVQVSAQTTVPQQRMEQVYNEVKTPFKYGLVIVPEDSLKQIDCPSVFRKGNRWYMTYIKFDGRGYQTWLAKSKDLLHWKTIGKLMSFGDTTNRTSMAWDANQRAGYIALQDTKWGGSYAVDRYDGKYWMSYIGGQDAGYEAGKLGIGIAFTKEKIHKPHEWQRLDKPVLAADDADVRWWENKKLYKSSIIEDNTKQTGHRFVMYYNANGDTSNNTPKWRWFERIGMAVSDDMVHWSRYKVDPVVHHRIGITGDGVVQRMGDLWVMFYFGAFWEERKQEAFNRFACSYDLVNWTDWNGDDLVKSTEPYDAKYAHKSYVVKWKGTVYHFYCAVNDKNRRGVAVATSVDKGKSGLVCP